jgi:hypothetical protein
LAVQTAIVPRVAGSRSDTNAAGSAWALRHALFVAVLVAVLFPSLPARATQCRAIDGGNSIIANIDAETRLKWLDRHLHVAGRNSIIWSAAWGTVYGALTIGQLGLLPSSNGQGEIAEKVVGSVASFIGVLSVAILPPKVIGDARWWAHKRADAASLTMDPCALLNMGEQLLLRDAADEEFGIGPLVHVGNFVINVAAGLVLGLGYGRWEAFSYTTVAGIVIGEVQVITRPINAIIDLRSYRLGELDNANEMRIPKVQWALTPTFSRDGAGAAFQLRW